MDKNGRFPTREELDKAFHFLQDEITRISVHEEGERMMEEKEGKGSSGNIS